MMLFTKKLFFSFTLSFVITLIAGFFIWNQILGQENKIEPKNFAASLLVSPEVIQDEVIQDDVASQDFASLAPVVMTEQERQNLLDDIQEKLDIIQQQVNKLITEQNKLLDGDDEQVEKIEETEEAVEEIVEETTDQADICTGQININTASVEDLDKITYVGPATAQKIIEARPFYSLNDLLKVSGIGEATLQKIIEQGCAYVDSAPAVIVAGGGFATTIYPKILISEIQVLPVAQRFIELYNPNSTDVDLTDWYLQRKDANDTSWNSLVSSTHFSGKTILAGGYFLISREFVDSDILLSITLSSDNSLALKDPDGEIIDQTSFSNVDENKSTCIVDFSVISWEVCAPTPKTQNVAYFAPTLQSIAITTPATKLIYNVGDTLDISGLLVTGTYSDNSAQVETITAANISGFDSSATATGQVLTITLEGHTATYLVDITEPVVQKNIVINEIQISPIEQRFVELYNPNSTDVDLTGWYLQRKTQNADSWSSFVSSTNFQGKIILANGYFLISRQIENSDISLSITLSDNNSLALKNPSRDIVDKVGWGQAIDPEIASAPSPPDGKSITRTSGIDTDNNSADFAISDTPTPKAGP